MMKNKEKPHKFLPYGRQSLQSCDSQAVEAVLKSDWLTQGPKVEEFEKRFSQSVGARYAVAVANGTAGLHLACMAIGVKLGVRVLTSPNTFLATSNSILYCGGKVVFADIDQNSLNLSLPEAAKKVSNMNISGMILVHFGGLSCDVAGFYKLAKKKKMFLIEDASHALGSQYRVGKRWYKVGSCSHSDMTIFSFHPIKAMTTAEGGMITTNRKDLYDKLREIRNHGMVKDSTRIDNPSWVFEGTSKKKTPPSWYYEMQSLGFNYRITDLQCALGISQLKRLNAFIEKRREVALMYNKAFKDISALELPLVEKNYKPSYHLYPIRLNLDRLTVSRRAIFEMLRKKNLGVQVHYIPVPLQPYYRKLGYKISDYPEAVAHYQRTISLPIFPAITNREVAYVILTVKNIIAKYTK